MLSFAKMVERRCKGESLNDVFYVEKILNVRIHEGVPQYLIKWKGYKAGIDVDAETWEPTENLINCKELLEEFRSDVKQENMKKKELQKEKRLKKQKVDRFLDLVRKENQLMEDVKRAVDREDRVWKRSVNKQNVQEDNKIQRVVKKARCTKKRANLNVQLQEEPLEAPPANEVFVSTTDFVKCKYCGLNITNKHAAKRRHVRSQCKSLIPRK